MKRSSGLTLVELVLAAMLAMLAAAAVISGYNFLFIQTKTGIGRGNLNLRIDYALEKIRLQCESASAIESGSLFEAGDLGPKDEFCITGESDPYTIDASNSAAKKKYCYGIDDDGNLTLEKSDTSGNAEDNEVLLSALYKPSISFEYSSGDNPFSLTVAIMATAKRIGAKDEVILKKEHIRFGYTKIIK